MNPFLERFSGDFAEQRQHAHVSRGNGSRAGHEQNEQDNENSQLENSLSGTAEIHWRQTATTEFKFWTRHFSSVLRPVGTATRPHHLHSLNTYECTSPFPGTSQHSLRHHR